MCIRWSIHSTIITGEQNILKFSQDNDTSKSGSMQLENKQSDTRINTSA